MKRPELHNIIPTMFLVLCSLDLVSKNNILHDNTTLTKGQGHKVRLLVVFFFNHDLHQGKTKQAIAAAAGSTGNDSVFHFVCWPAECPVMLHCVLIGTLAHVVHPRVADGEALLHYVIHEVNPEGHLLMVVTWSKGE